MSSAKHGRPKLNDRKYDTGHESRVRELLNRSDVRDCIGGIVSARGHLRELSSVGRESSRWENFRQDLEDEVERLLLNLNAGIDELRDLIEKHELNWPEGPSVRTGDQKEHWSLGTEEFRGHLIPFLRGELEPVRRVVVAPGLPDGVVILFLSIPRLRDLLERENHGWGYHYHYLDSKSRRSDTLLTFEHELRTLQDGQQVRVLTWERHSEKGHFAARAARWGDKKRESVYAACTDDSAKRALSDYKLPAKDAEAVWPI